MLDIDSSGPTLARLLLVAQVISRYIFGCRILHRVLGGKQVVLQHIGQARNADTEKPDSARGVNPREQGGGNRTDDIRAIRCTQQCP